jgi:hypothetical protein
VIGFRSVGAALPATDPDLTDSAAAAEPNGDTVVVEEDVVYVDGLSNDDDI